MGRTLHIVLNDKRVLYEGDNYKKFEETVNAHKGESGLTSYFLERKDGYLSISREILDRMMLGVDDGPVGEKLTNSLESISVLNESVIQALKGLL